MDWGKHFKAQRYKSQINTIKSLINISYSTCKVDLWEAVKTDLNYIIIEKVENCANMHGKLLREIIGTH